MPDLVYSTSLTDGTTAYASDVQGMFNDVSTLLNTTGLDNDNIQAGSLTNASISSSAGISFSKLATLTSANILVGNVSNVATAVAVTGDIGLTNAGVASISSGVIVNGDVSASAGISLSKLESLTSARLIVGSSGNVPTAVDVTGDVTISNAGVTTLGSSKVTTAKINNAAVTADKLATGAQAASVATSQTTTSTSFTDLATVGPAVTATVGANGLALIVISAQLFGGGGQNAFMGYAVSGANTVAATGNDALINGSATLMQISYSRLLTGLTPGSTTFTAKYATSAGTSTFVNRSIQVIPL